MTAAVALPAAMALIAGAVSYSNALATRANMQNAIDAAVLAGATELRGPDPIAIANRAFLANLSDSTKSSTTNISASFEVRDSVIHGRGFGLGQNPMGGLLGTRTFDIPVNASATLESIPICVLGLNGFDKGSFDINGNPVFKADCAVQANTGSSSGMTQEGNAPARARKFSVAGRQKTNNFSPMPVEGADKVPDPYASLPFPAYSSCAGKSKGVDIKIATDIMPGTYCGGLTIDGANVRMAPGEYIMVGGPFLVKAGGAASGDEVLIGFTGADSTLRLWGNSSLTLTSPKSGTWKNMQFMVDNSSEDAKQAWVSIGGAAGNPDGTPKLTYDGVAYFASQNFWVFGNAIVNANSPTVAIVADKIWAQGAATIEITSNNTRNISVTPGPGLAAGARLLK